MLLLDISEVKESKSMTVAVKIQNSFIFQFLQTTWKNIFCKNKLYIVINYILYEPVYRQALVYQQCCPS